MHHLLTIVHVTNQQYKEGALSATIATLLALGREAFCIKQVRAGVGRWTIGVGRSPDRWTIG